VLFLDQRLIPTEEFQKSGLVNISIPVNGAMAHFRIFCQTFCDDDLFRKDDRRRRNKDDLGYITSILQ
jgi:hypothetical protein